MADKGDQYVRLYTLAPFLFAYSDLDQKWKKMLRESGLLCKQKREESLETLSDRELDIVDIVDSALNLVLSEYTLHSKEKDVMLSEAFQMLDKLDTNELPYRSVLAKASKKKLFQHFWQKMANEEFVTDIQKFSVVFVLKQYYTHVKNPNLIKDTDRRLASETQKANPWKVKGNDSFRNSRPVEAVNHYTRAIELAHFSHVLYGNRAQAFLKIGKYRDALSDSRRALALKPDWVKGFYRLSEAALGMRMFSRAERANADGIQICENKGDTNDDLIGLKDQQQRIADTCKKAADEDPDDFLSDVPDLVSSDESSSSDEESDQSTPQASQDNNAQAPDFLEELETCLTEGTTYYFNNVSVLGVRQLTQALDLIAKHGITTLNLTEEEELSIRHVYILCCVATSSSKWLRAGLKCIENYLQSAAQQYRSLLLYDRALCYMTLFRFEKAMAAIRAAIEIIATCAPVENLKWPKRTTVIDITKPNNLQAQLTTLSRECLYPPEPEGLCRLHTNSEDQDTKIYFDDPDFKGMVRLICCENCNVDFHPHCWKDYKHTLGDRVVDRAVLHQICLTPDCRSPLHKIVIFRPHNLPDGKTIISETEPTKVIVPKVVQKMKKVSEKKIQAKLAKKERRREMRSKTSGIELELTVTTVTADSPVPEAVPSPLTVSDDRGRTGTEDGVLLAKRDTNTDENKTKAGKVRQKPKKRKDKTVLPVEVKFSDKRMLENAESAEIDQDDELLSFPFSVPNSLRKKLHKFQEGRISQPSDTSFLTGEERVIENTFSFFVDFFSANGPQPLDSPLLQQFMDDFPEEAISVINRAGGVRQFLLGSLKFCAADNILSLMVHAHLARQLADKLTTKHHQVDRPPFQFNPQAPEFTPSNKQTLVGVSSQSSSPPLYTECNEEDGESESNEERIEVLSTMGLDDYGAGDSVCYVELNATESSGNQLSSFKDPLPTSSGDYSLTRNKTVLQFSHSELCSPAHPGAECLSQRPHSYPSFDSTRHGTRQFIDVSLPTDFEELPKNDITDIDSGSVSSASPIFPDSVWTPTVEDVSESRKKQTEERTTLDNKFPPEYTAPRMPLPTFKPQPFTPVPQFPVNSLLVNRSHVVPFRPISPQISEGLKISSVSEEVQPNALMSSGERVTPQPDLLLKCQQLDQELCETKERLGALEFERDELKSLRQEDNFKFDKDLNYWRHEYCNLKSSLNKDEKLVENLTEQLEMVSTQKRSADEELMRLSKLCEANVGRAVQAEIVLLEERRKTQVNFLEKRLREIEGYCKHLDSYLKFENRQEASVPDGEVRKAYSEWERCNIIYTQILLETKEEFERKIDFVRQGYPLPTLLPSQLPHLPELPNMIQLNHLKVDHLQERGASNFPNSDALNRTRVPLRPITPPQRTPRRLTPPEISPLHPDQCPRSTQPTPIRPLLPKQTSPIRPLVLPNQPTPIRPLLPLQPNPIRQLVHKQPTPIRPLVPSKGAPHNRQPLRPLGASVPTYPYKRLPSNLLPPNASQSHSPGKTTMDLIMERLETLFPSFERYHFLELIQDYRNQRGGSLSGVPMDDIIRHVIEGVQNKVKEEGNTTPRALRGSIDESNHNDISREEDPCPICHEEITETDCTTLDCRHRFHSKCIRLWLQEQSTCPNCRTYALLQDEFPSLR